MNIMKIFEAKLDLNLIAFASPTTFSVMLKKKFVKQQFILSTIQIINQNVWSTHWNSNYYSRY